ncbi:MAG: hypothetical protein IT305_16440 [Chloroflexi bacterium]|nr:hypothetical protein [Chloroflexota bacterium]
MRRVALLRSTFVILAVLASLILGALGQQALPIRAQEGGLLGPDSGPRGPAPDSAGVLRRRIAAVDRTAVARMTGKGARTARVSESSRLTLFADTTFGVTWERNEPTSDGSGTVWTGRVTGDAASLVTLVLDGGLVSGNVRTSDRLFHIQSVDAASVAVDEIDLRAATPELAPLRPGPDQLAGPRVAGTVDDGSTVDVLFVYTPTAKQEAGGAAAIENQLDLVVAETNATFANSGVVQRLRIVQASEIAYTETGSGISDLSRLRNTSEGYMDSVHALRDNVGADIVVLVVANLDGCGVAYLSYPPASWFQSYAFAVVQRACAVSNLSVAHELGHIMGAEHDWATTPDGDPDDYNRGYIDSDHAWRTVMSYPQPCGSCPRLPYFSNPDMLHDGRPMGVPAGYYHGADNRTVLNDSRMTVANFRSSRPASWGLTVSSTAGGSVVSVPAGIACGGSCTASYPSGTTVTLTATPLAGQRFAGWGGACSGTGACSVVMTADRTVSATFAPIAPILAVTLSDGPDPLEAGSDLTYTLTVKNAGSIPIAGTGSVTLALSAPIQYVRSSATPSLAGSCKGEGGASLQEGGRTSIVSCTWTGLALDPGASQPVTVVVRPVTAGTLTATAGAQVSAVTAPAATVATTVTAPPPVACSPRPPIVVETRPTTDGRLAVTVAATGDNNRLLRLHFFSDVRVDKPNGLVEIPGRADAVRADYTYSFTDVKTTLTFYVRRALPGQSVTVPLEVTDGCGTWPTLVGGGPTGF